MTRSMLLSGVCQTHQLFVNRGKNGDIIDYEQFFSPRISNLCGTWQPSKGVGGGRGCAKEKERGYPIPFSLIIAPATQAIGTVEWGEAADLWCPQSKWIKVSAKNLGCPLCLKPTSPNARDKTFLLTFCYISSSVCFVLFLVFIYLFIFI